MSLPFELFVPPGTENIDVGFGLLAQPNFCALDRADNPRGEVDRPAEDVALLDLQRADMDPRP